MKVFDFELKNDFPFLSEDERNPFFTALLPENLASLGRENNKRPCLLICPGGGYSYCSDREAEPIAMHFLTQGYNVFILWYSCSPSRFPVQLCEVAATLEVIHKNKDAWECDTEKIAIMGFSAGGHLAAHYTNAYDCKEVREVFRESKGVNASLLCYPVITASPEFTHKDSILNLTGKQNLSNDITEKFSCERMVSERTAPTFLVHAANDSGVPSQNSLLYALELAKHKIPYELHIYPTGNHGFSTADKQTINNISAPLRVHAWIKDAQIWLDEIFGCLKTKTEAKL